MNKYGQKWETFSCVDWNTLTPPLKALLHLTMLTKKNVRLHRSSLLISESSSVPYICRRCHLVLSTVPLTTMWSPCGWYKRKDSQTAVFSIYVSNALVILCCGEVCFSLCSLLSCSLLSEGSSLKAPAVTLRMSVSSLFLVLQTVLDLGALKRIYKRQEIATFIWRDIKYWAWNNV